MWKVRQKELELDERIQGRRDRRITGSRESTDPTRSMRHGKTSYDASSNCSSSKRGVEECYSTDYGGFRDEEIEEFLHSRFRNKPLPIYILVLYVCIFLSDSYVWMHDI